MISLRRSLALAPFALVPLACVPPGNSTPTADAGSTSHETPSLTPTSRPSINVMTSVFEDNFDRAGSAGPTASAIPSASASASTPAAADAALGSDGASEASALATATASNLGPAWLQAGTNVWHIEQGRLCGSNAHNHGVWLQRTLPVNARIEFDAISDDLDGDIKAEAWGDGRSSATGMSYTNATSYLTLFGAWKNTMHALARLNEHGNDRKLIKIDKSSDDPREQPVTAGQTYHFKIERADGKTVKWSVNGLEYLSFPDPQPLAGMGHDHFGFNDWETRICFDNLKVTPLP